MRSVRLSCGSVDLFHARGFAHRFPPHVHDEHAIGVFEGGASEISYRGATATAVTGSLLAISAGQVHSAHAPTAEGWSYRMLYPSPAVLRTVIGLEAGDLFPRAVIRDAELGARMGMVHRLLLAEGASMQAEASLAELLRVLWTRHARATWDDGARTAPMLVAERARDYLEAHNARAVPLAELAAVVGVSVFHLVRVFGRRFGVPPHAYLRMLRVSRAREMLRTGKPASIVAYECGFADQSHFTRSFKDVVGMPPGRFTAGVRHEELRG
ncbi:MAG: AraC family transcriptional regulator [Gemmatimonadetes bacterium]|nr:AraC family transcriptional regulator [Gemmatimonadota bacterium]